MNSKRIYETLLRLYPSEHQASFAPEMAAVFEEAAEERRGRGWAVFTGFVATELAGLVSGAGMEWIANLTQQKNYVVDDTPPEADEMQAAQKRVQLTLRRMEYAIAHHQFQQARRYSDEERRERENLRVLQEKTPAVR